MSLKQLTQRVDPPPVKAGPFVLWCMSIDPLTRWHPLTSYPDAVDAVDQCDKRTVQSEQVGTMLRYKAMPAGMRP